MSKILDINEHALMVLSLFSNGYDREYYIREICTYIPVSHGTAQTILLNLEKKGVLASSQRGKNRFFRIKPGEISIQYFILAEMYKKICFMEEKPYISEIMNKVTDHTRGITLLFGSYAKGYAKADSDIDIFIAGSYDDREVLKIEKMYDSEVNIKAYPVDVFGTGDQSDPLVHEVVKNHIVWKNAESFVREVITQKTGYYGVPR